MAKGSLQRVPAIIVPSDDATFEHASRVLISSFEHWAPAGLETDTFFLDHALRYRWLTDGRILRWQVADLVHMLTCHFPSHVVVHEDFFRRAVPTLTAFVRFLGDESLMDDKSSSADELVAALQATEPSFMEAMADESLFDPGKTLIVAMLNDGVDLNDPDAVARWNEEFNARPFADRDRLIGRFAPGRRVPRPFPPVGLPTIAEATRAAGEAVTVQRMRRLVDFIGDGRKLTKKGNLTVADGKALHRLMDLSETEPYWRLEEIRSSEELVEVDLCFRLSRTARLTRIANGRILTTRIGRSFGADPLGGWTRLFDAIGGFPLLYNYGCSRFSDVLDSTRASNFFDLYESPDGMDVSAYIETAWRDVLHTYALDTFDEQQLEFLTSSIEADVYREIRALVDLGVYEWTGWTETVEYGTSKRRGGKLHLSGPAKLRMNADIRAMGRDAPVIGDIARLEPKAFVRAIAGLSAPAARSEIEHRVREHGSPAVIRDMIAVAMGTDDPVEQAGTFAVLDELADEVTPTMRELIDEHGFQPVAMAWLARRGEASLADLDFAPSADLDIEFMGALVDSGATDEMIRQLERTGSADEQIARISEFWRVDDASVERVLDAIGRTHSHRDVAKAARKTLLKFRSKS